MLSFKNRSKLLMFIPLATLFAACQTTPVDQSQLQTHRLPVNPHAASVQSSGPVRVAIVGFEQSSQVGRFSPDLANTAANRLAGSLANHGNIKLIERNEIGGLTREMLNAEAEAMQGLRSNVINYAIIGRIDVATFESELVVVEKGSNYYRNKSAISGILTVYRIDPTQPATVVRSFALSGSSYETSEKRKSHDPALVNRALLNSISSASTTLADNFRPNAQIIGAETDGRKFFVRLNMGSSSGIRPDAKVEFYTRRSVVNQLTGEATVETVKLPVRGTVSGSVQANSALVEISRRDIDSLRLGDTASISKDDSWRALLRGNFN